MSKHVIQFDIEIARNNCLNKVPSTSKLSEMFDRWASLGCSVFNLVTYPPFDNSVQSNCPSRTAKQEEVVKVWGDVIVTQSRLSTDGSERQSHGAVKFPFTSCRWQCCSRRTELSLFEGRIFKFSFDNSSKSSAPSGGQFVCIRKQLNRSTGDVLQVLSEIFLSQGHS
jgi:hypothetical protein